MGAKKKTVKKDLSQTSGVASSSATSSKATGDSQRLESAVVTTQPAPVVVEKLMQSSNVVTKSSSSNKVSSSSQEQNFYSTSSTTNSSSKTQKSGKTHQLQSQSDAFLRGERTTGDIDARTSKNGSTVLESVDLHNVASDFGTTSNLDNMVSAEIQSKDSRAASSSNELVTNTLSTTKSINDGNRNDVIAVESGRKSGETTTAMPGHSRDVNESSSTVQGSSTATSSSTFHSSTTVDGVTDVKEMQSSDTQNAATSKSIKNGRVVDSKNVSDSSSTFTSKGFDDNNAVTGSPSSTHQQISSSTNTGGNNSPGYSPSGPTKILRNGRFVNVENVTDTSRHFGDHTSKLISDKTSKKFDDHTMSTAVDSHNRDVNESSSIVHGSTTTTSSSSRQQFSSSTIDGVTDAKEVKSSASTNAASSKVLRNGRLVDSKNVADTTTTFTSKVFDDKTKSWVVVEQSSVNETDVMLPAVQPSIDSASPSNKMNTMTISSTASGIDSTNSTKVDNLSSSNKTVKSDVQTSSKSSKEVHEKNMSSKKHSSRDEKLVSTSSNETVQVYDNKTKTWKNVEVGAINQQRRPSYMRYRSQNDDGSWHTVYKRKLYDEFSKSWKIVDERVVSSEDHSRMTQIPEMIENATNITTTTYTTKIYDTKTGKWTIVDEKSYVDKESANVTQDIKREIEKDQPDLANIITTTETTKIFDASINKWKLVDEKQHTDVYEKTTEMDEKEDLMYRRNITDETNIINNAERNLLQENLNEKHTRTTDSVDYIRSDHLIDESVSSSDLVNQVVIKEDVRSRKDTKKKIDKTYESTHQHKEQCICEMCTCGRHRCPHEEQEHLKIEGDFYKPEKEPYIPVERQKPFKPHDNLTVSEGTFEGRRSEDFKAYKTERSTIVRHEDNLRVSDGQFSSETTSKRDFQREIEEDSPIRRNTYTKEETEVETIRRRTWTKEELEAVRQKVKDDEKPKYKSIERPTQFKPTDNLGPSDDPFYSPEKDKFVPAERPQQFRPTDNLRPEGSMEMPEKNHFRPADKVTQVKPTDNLKMTGEFTTPEKHQFRPAEKVTQVRPVDSLRPEGDFQQPERHEFRPAEKVTQVRPTDNLKMTGEFTTPEKHQFRPAEKVTQVRPVDSLRPEGDFQQPEKTQFRPAEKVKQIRHEDNLKMTGDFYTPDKTKYAPGERPTAKKPTDNLKMEGSMSVTKKNEYGQQVDNARTTHVKNQHNSTIKSSIVLGEDTNIMKSTNQINFQKIATSQKANETVIQKSTVKDDQKTRDGAIMITTKKVTTVLANDQKKKNTNAGGRKNMSSISFENDENVIINRQSKVNVINNVKDNQVIREGSISHHTSEKVINGVTASSVTNGNTQHTTETSQRVGSDNKSINTTNGTTNQVSSTSHLSQSSNQQTNKSSSINSHQQLLDHTSVDHHQGGNTVHSTHVSNNQQSSVQSGVDSQHHHRKSVITESSEQTNSILTRKSTDRQNETINNKGLSVTGAQQRKSIGNLHDQSQFSSNTSDRKSLSYMHRTGGGDTHECQMHPSDQQHKSSTQTSSSTTHKVIGGDHGGQELRNYERSTGRNSTGTSKNTSSSINFGQESTALHQSESRHSSSTSRNVVDSSVHSSEYRVTSSSGGGGNDLRSHSTTTTRVTPTAGSSSAQLASHQNRITGGSNINSSSTEYRTTSSGGNDSRSHSTTTAGASSSQPANQNLGPGYNIHSSSNEYRTSSGGNDLRSTSSTNQSRAAGSNMHSSLHSSEHRIISSSGGGGNDLRSRSTNTTVTPTAGASSQQIAHTQDRSVRRHQVNSSSIVLGGYDNSSSQSRLSSTNRSEYVKDSFKPCPAHNLDQNTHMKQTRATKSHQFFLHE